MIITTRPDSDLTYLSIEGPFAFDIGEINAAQAISVLVIRADNHTYGNIERLPAGLVQYSNTGSNRTHGRIDYLPHNLIIYSNRGENVSTGDTINLPSTLEVYSNRGESRVNVTGLPDFPRMSEFLQRGSGVLTETEINLLLQRLDDGVAEWIDEKLIDLDRGHATPTGAGITAKNSLIAKGVNVLTN